MRLSNQSVSVRGKIQELLLLFFPLLVISFSNSFFLFLDKILLVHLSSKAMEAAVNSAYVCQIFQGSSVALVMMAQVNVGRWYGAKEWKMIGPGMWQFIWFSIGSMLITFPLSILFGTFYFQRIEIEEIVLPYFYFLCSFNFLYPLGASLSCFYLGQGKTRLVVFSTIGMQFFRFCLAFLLIFGWGYIPAYGLMGVALSNLIAQGSFCIILFICFLKSQNSNLFHINDWHFKAAFFGECIYPGLLRAFSRILNFVCWAAIAHLMAEKGGDYLLILSVGGALFFFLPFVGDAICQTQATLVSQILGSKQYHLLKLVFRTGLGLVIISSLLAAIPFLMFPSLTFHLVFPGIAMEREIITKVFFGIWSCFVMYTLTMLPVGHILAFKDTRFSLFMGFMTWVHGYLFMSVFLEIIKISPEWFWFANSIMHGLTAFLYWWRMRWLQEHKPPLNVILQT